jgi:DNA ligase-1
MRKFAETCEAIAATTKKLLKMAIVAEYLKLRTTDDAAVSAVFLSGIAAKNESTLTTAYRKHGDLGAVAGEILPQRSGQGLGILEVADSFRQIAAARGAASKTTLVRDLLMRATPLEAKYIIKIMTGDLRIGLKESLLEEAIAKAYGGAAAESQKEVQRANMLLGTSAELCGWRRRANWLMRK